MRGARAMICLALALIWVGMPVHCLVEPLANGTVFSCANEQDCNSPADKGCDDDFCNSLESAKYFSKRHVVVVAVPVFQALDILPEERAPKSEAFAVSTGFDPLDFLHASWQFGHRTAAAPRAPSLTA